MIELAPDPAPVERRDLATLEHRRVASCSEKPVTSDQRHSDAKTVISSASPYMAPLFSEVGAEVLRVRPRLALEGPVKGQLNWECQGPQLVNLGFSLCPIMLSCQENSQSVMSNRFKELLAAVYCLKQCLLFSTKLPECRACTS